MQTTLKNNCHLRILISGGWGYGNLGDDAILHATINLLEKRFPQSEIVISSYDSQATKKETNGKYKVIPSAHRLLFGDLAFKQLNIYGKCFYLKGFSPFLARVMNRLSSYWEHFYPQKTATERMMTKRLGEYKETLKYIDIFVMTGGGYFNNWEESLLSRIEELKLAQQLSIPTYIVGQTLDRFKPLYTPELSRLFSQCTGISVRDVFSAEILRKMDVVAKVIPDLALGGLELNTYNDNVSDIVYIPAEANPKNNDVINQSIAEYAKTNSLSVDITLTRLYNADVNDAKRIYRKFIKENVDVRLRIPKDFTDICSYIVGAKNVISRNLHGLILGYIGGARILSLNDGWKFKGFLQQIGQCDNYVGGATTTDNVRKGIEKMMSTNYDGDTRTRIRTQVTDGFNNLFAE